MSINEFSISSSPFLPPLEDLEYLRQEDKRYCESNQYPNNTSGNANDLSASANGSCKSFVDWALNCCKSKVVLSLKQSNSNTPPIELAVLLEELFLQWPSNEGHWLWIAQRYTARCINRQINDTFKQCLHGVIRKTPPAYFIYRIKHRKKRRQVK